MVFLHGLPGTRTSWVYQQAHFANTFRTIAIDLPGHGRSPAALSGITVPDIADACWEAVDEAEPGGTIVLVGLSAGSVVAKYMANQRPGSVLALVLTGGGFYETAGDPARPAAKGIASRHVPAYRERGAAHRREHLTMNFSPAFRESALGAYFVDLEMAAPAAADTDGTVQVLLALDPPDPAWLHSGIRAPTLILTGSEDRSRPQQEALQRHIAGAEFHLIEGAGHCCNIEKPWEYDALVLEFLRRRGVVLLPR